MPPPEVSRNISLTPELAGFVEDCLASGDYGNTEEVIRAALQLLRGDAENPARTVQPRWPVGGGECGRLIRERDWSTAPVGPIDRWPAALRTTVANIVNSPVAKVVMWGPDHIMLYNDSYSGVAGERHPAVLGQPVAVAFPELWEWNRAILEAGMKGEIVSHTTQPIVFHRPNGPETLILDLFYTPVYDDSGRVGGVMCTIIDNSKRVEAERNLAAREAELRRITDAVPMLISYLDRNYVYGFANSCYQDWFGIAPETIVGRPAPDVLGEAFFEERRPDIDRALAGETFRAETLLPSGEGTTRRCEIRYIPDVAADGAINGTYILAIDIEERAAREAALNVSNQRFRTAMDAVHGVLWTTTADGRMLGEQPGWAGLTGQHFDAYQGHGWAEAVHPEDVRPTIRAWRRAATQKTMFVFEHRVRQHGGHWRNFAIRGLPILDPTGQILEWVGVHTDITHQRAAEAALREQAANLTQQVRQRQHAEAQLRQLNEELEARVIAEIDERRRAEVNWRRPRRWRQSAS
jgi:putative addiction module CopG family antidote